MNHPILDELHQSCTQGAFRSQFCVIYVPAWECIACAFRVKILNTTWFIYLCFAYVLSIAFAMCHHISRRITLHIKFTVRREPPDRFIQLSNWFSNKCRSSNSLSRLVSSHLIPLWLFQWERKFALQLEPQHWTSSTFDFLIEIQTMCSADEDFSTHRIVWSKRLIQGKYSHLQFY